VAEACDGVRGGSGEGEGQEEWRCEMKAQEVVQMRKLVSLQKKLSRDVVMVRFTEADRSDTADYLVGWGPASIQVSDYRIARNTRMVVGLVASSNQDHQQLRSSFALASTTFICGALNGTRNKSL
jgi:hypothetical protein